MAKKSDFDLRSFLPYLLNQAAEESSLAFQQIYKDRYGMLRTEWRVLFHLGIYGQMTAKDIGTAAKLHKTKISRAVARLEERRFLTRTVQETDRRHETLTLTHIGEAAYQDLLGVAADYDLKLSLGLTAKENAFLRRILRKLAHLEP